ncbi:MAG: linear amide C-N hydrolase [Saccharofermentans sp.]|nr:linear amide C-N hydrolase [Saccharofermentans sp.]
MKKRNKKAIIITAIVMLIGVLLVLAGFFGGWFLSLFSKEFDYKNIQPEDLGKTVRTDVFVYYDNIDIEDKALQVLGDVSSDDDFAFILVDLSALSEKEKDMYFSMTASHITIQGRLRAVDDAEYQETIESLYRLYDDFLYERLSDPENNYTEEEKAEKIEIYHQYLRDPVIPYCIELDSVSGFDWTPFIPAGIILFVIALIFEICFVFKLKKRIVLPIVFGLMIVIPGIMFFNHIRTILSIHKINDDLYTLKNYECTDTQAMLDSNASDINGLLDWICAKHFYGMPNPFEADFDFGCAAFAAVTPEGDHIFGRNFDFPETDTLLIYSHPEGAYESIGMADIGVFGVGHTYPISPDSPLGRIVMILAPYAVVDGMNEMGVGAGILQLSLEETHQDQGNPDLLVFCAIRGILDYCASVDEALAFLESYDIHSDTDCDYHLFITDRTGRYVVVEWLDGEMVVTERPSCTNSVVAPGEFYDMGDPDERMGTIDACLDTDHIVTEQEAMEILDKVHNKNDMTEWSCIYNLDDFTVTICLDADYGQSYTFSAEELS